MDAICPVVAKKQSPLPPLLSVSVPGNRLFV